MAQNYDDVLGQLREAGLQVDHLVTGKIQRVKVEGDREKRGWYMLHEWATADAQILLVGSFGVYRGDDPGTTKVKLTGRKLTDDERAAFRQRLADDRKKAEAARRAESARAAARAESAWRRCLPSGECDYLKRKAIGAHGVRFTESGALVVPMMDVAGRVHGLQFILSRAAHGRRIAKTGRDKEYWPAGLAKRGHFHLIGMIQRLVLVAEGYATAASLHEATGLPVAVAFDAGNLQPVAEALRKRYRFAHILVCADDDCFSEGNPGITRASAAALAVDGAWIAPRFADESARKLKFEQGGGKLTDFNDLHVLDGLATVRSQIEARLHALRWNAAPPPARPDTPRGKGDALRPIESVQELLDRYSLVYGQKGTVFDAQEHCLLALSDMRDTCIRREIHRAWQEHPDRAIVRVDEVGFDPGGDDPRVKCNLWAGWPTVPKSGACDRLLELLQYMCAGDANPQRLYQWVLRWISYPIQHPGAKLKTTLVIHGPQGTGKNLFFECVMAIYGRYGRIIDQSAIEDKFNDWASRKLFLIADEVVARADLYHVKNKLKAFITGDWIRINPKNYAAYEERNHVNMVFLSNERMPVVLEEDDRRHVVIWTPEKLSQGFYDEVLAEIRAGGIAALHHHLLHLDLGDFRAGSLPPMTTAKAELIDLGRDSTSRFYGEWAAGELDGIGLMPALSQDVFDLYRAWCARNGIGRPAPLNKLVDALHKRHKCTTPRKRYLNGVGITNPKGFVIPPGSIELPPGQSETGFLGDCVTAFKNAVQDYKGTGHAY